MSEVPLERVATLAPAAASCYPRGHAPPTAGKAPQCRAPVATFEKSPARTFPGFVHHPRLLWLETLTVATARAGKNTDRCRSLHGAHRHRCVGHRAWRVSARTVGTNCPGCPAPRASGGHTAGTHRWNIPRVGVGQHCLQLVLDHTHPHLPAPHPHQLKCLVDRLVAAQRTGWLRGIGRGGERPGDEPCRCSQ